MPKIKKKKRAQDALWAKENPDKVKAHKQKWRNKNIESVKAKHEQWKNTLIGRLCRKISHLKKAKRNKVLDFDIDGNFLVSLWEKQNGKCAITNYDMSYENRDTLYSVSVDRIDSLKGYVKDNVQLVCVAINFAKNKYSNDDK